MTYDQDVTDLISKRFSCRTYLDQPIAEDALLALDNFLHSGLSGPFDTQPRFQLVVATEEDRKALRGLTTYGFIRGATGFIVGAITHSAHDLEDFGYQMECIILRATDLGLGTCWLGGTFNKSRFAQKIGAVDSESLPAVVSTGYVADKPRRLDAIIRRGARSDRRLPWDQLFFDTAFDVAISPEEAGLYAIPLEMVRLAPSASNQQPWRIVRAGGGWHFFLQRTPGYGEGGLSRFMRTADMQRIDMGIAMSHFELTASHLGLRGRWRVEEPAIGTSDGRTEYTASWMAD
jgi:nitroreductase